MVKLSDIKLFSWDNCYTFCLKYLGVWEKYQHLDIPDFLSQADKDFNIETKNWKNLELVVYESKSSNETPTYKLIQDGQLMFDFWHRSSHFMIILEGKYILDVSFYDGKSKPYTIRVRDISNLLLDSSDYYIYKIINL